MNCTSRRHSAEAWALVPVKASRHAKTRLSTVLSSYERSALQRAMLCDVLAALSRARRLAGVAVISPDHDIAAIASRHGASYIAERPTAGDDLNAAVVTGVERLRKAGAAVVIVIPADLPLSDPAEVDRAVALREETGATVVVPDRHRMGTNALVFDPCAPPAFVFGPSSFRRYAGGTAGGAVTLLPLASLALDIDTPADLEDMAECSAATGPRETCAVIAAIRRRRAALNFEEGNW